MGGTSRQIESITEHMFVDYLDLCMVHFPEVGPGTGSHGEYNSVLTMSAIAFLPKAVTTPRLVATILTRTC